MSDLASLLRRGLEEACGEAAPERVDALAGYTRLLERWAARINLTGHRDAETIAGRLVLDAVALWTALPAPAARVADLGSGAGLPGFPIAILAPDTQVVLVESRLRRHHFQRAAQRDLGLPNLRALRGRIEELDPEVCDLVVAQAVAPPATVLGWMRPWARAGGWLAIPGVADPAVPLTGPASPSRAAAQGLEEVHVARYQAPLESRERTVWLARVRSA
ncbi:MAG: 16S rRNA (guanine(527)-N(7))-methyltransferase RsmG [Myxococcota bacterium]|nr:16S rRNA (guanine(527)-N(7))-methyltransferase RsmG [Myxococcota bacterium]